MRLAEVFDPDTSTAVKKIALFINGLFAEHAQGDISFGQIKPFNLYTHDIVHAYHTHPDGSTRIDSAKTKIKNAQTEQVGYRIDIKHTGKGYNGRWELVIRATPDRPGPGRIYAVQLRRHAGGADFKQVALHQARTVAGLMTSMHSPNSDVYNAEPLEQVIATELALTKTKGRLP